MVQNTTGLYPAVRQNFYSLFRDMQGLDRSLNYDRSGEAEAHCVMGM